MRGFSLTPEFMGCAVVALLRNLRDMGGEGGGLGTQPVLQIRFLQDLSNGFMIAIICMYVLLPTQNFIKGLLFFRHQTLLTPMSQQPFQDSYVAVEDGVN